MSEHFIIPKKYYYITFVALLILTVITVAVAQVDLGVLNTPVAVLIASIKVCFVGAFFMGLRWEKFNLVLVFGAIAAMILFFLFTFADVAYRGAITEQVARPYEYNSPVKLVDKDAMHYGNHGDKAHKKGGKH